ncbi:MAG: ABC transporter permease [Chloroflexi bacterium]|nr:ABC transporter permease [Chloroflexota bacterium]
MSSISIPKKSGFLTNLQRSMGGVLRRSLTIFLSVFLAIIVGSIIMLLYGQNPIMIYKLLIMGAFGSQVGFFVTIQRATPIIFTAVASALAFRTGVFNVGVEGQFFIGAIAGTYVGYAFKMPTIIHLPLSLLAGFAGGALWAFFPTLMRQKLGVSEIITTIMTNYLATYLISWLTTYPLAASAVTSETPFVQPTAVLPQFQEFTPFGKGTQASVGIFIALGVAFVMWYIFKRTKLGYEWRMVGLSSLFSEFGGINLNKTFIGGMLVSGGIAGLGGAVEILGVWRKYKNLFAVGFGFKGNLAALLGGQNIIGSTVAASLYGAMESGALGLEWNAGVPRQLIDIVVGLIIFFMAAEGMWDFLRKIKIARGEPARRTTENLEV